MKILMLNFEFPPIGGGTANANYYFLKEISKMKDVQVDLITSKIGRGNKIEKFSSNINLYKIGIKKKDLHHWTGKEMLEWCIKSYLLTNKLTKKENYNFIHAWNAWPPGVIAHRFRRRSKLILALRGHDVPGYEKRFKLIEKLFLRKLSKKVWKDAYKITANSEGLKELALNTLNRDIIVIPNGVNTEEFKPLKNKKKNKKITLITTGRLGQRKGHIYLIEALKSLPDFKLLIVGQGSELSTLKEASKGLDVEFLGYIDHSKLNSILNKADIYVSPSLVEGMSNSIMEAMASGLPIVTTNVGGTSELIKGNGAIIEKTHSPESIVKALSHYKNNQKLIQQQSLVSRRIAESMSWSNTVKSYFKEVYV